MKILIDAYNIGLEQGTGVATYGRGVCEIVNMLGNEGFLLYDKRGVSKKNAVLSGATFFEKRQPKANTKYLTLRRFAEIPFSKTANLVSIGNTLLTQGLSAPLPINNGLFNISDIFLKAKIYFQLTGKFLEIKCPEQIDVAHWTYPLPIKIAGAKNIYTIHDIIPLRLPYVTLDNKKYYWTLLNELTKSADLLLTVSETSKLDMINAFDIDSRKIINTFQHVNVLRDNVRVFNNDELYDLFGLQEYNYFVFCGAIEPKKNLPRLLEAFLTTKTNAKLLVIGPDGWETSYDPLVKQHLSKINTFTANNRILRLGYVSREMLLSLLKTAKGFVFPSIYEGFGLPVLEAMSLGIPVITSNFGSLKEVVGDAALTVDPFDVSSIRAALLALDTNHELRNELTKKGLERAKVFSIESHKTKLNQIYTSLQT